MIAIKHGDRWISFGGHRQKVSELNPDLRAKFVAMGLLEEDDKRKIITEETKKITVSKTKTRHHRMKKAGCHTERIEEIRMSSDNGLDIVMRMVGRSLGRAWVKLTR